MYIAIYWSGLWGSGGCAMGGVGYGVFSGLAVVLAEFAFWGGGGVAGLGAMIPCILEIFLNFLRCKLFRNQ